MKNKLKSESSISEAFEKKCTILFVLFFLVGVFCVIAGMSLDKIHLTVFGTGVFLMAFILGNVRFLGGLMLLSLNPKNKK